MGRVLTHDAAGGQMYAETGVGRIENLVPKGERNVQVTINADHLQQPVTAWVDKQGPLWGRVQAARESERKIWYRIDVHRSRGVAPDIEFADLSNMQKVRDLVALEQPENAHTVIDGPVTAHGPGPTSGPVSPAPPNPAPAASPAPPASPAPDSATPRGENRPTRDQVDHQVGQALHLAAQGDGGMSQQSVALRALALAIREEAWTETLTELYDRAEMAGAGRGQIAAAEKWGREAREARARAADEERRALPPSPPAQRLRGPDPEDPWATGGPSDRPTPDDVAVSDAASEAVARARDPHRTGERAARPNVPDDGTGSHDRRSGMSPVSGLSRRSIAVVGDAKPWELMNSDGRLNLSSWAAGAVFELTNLAGRLLVTRARQVYEENPSGELHAPGAEKVGPLAATLVQIADRIQCAARGARRPDRQSSSHRLARQALREAIDVYPIPWGVGPEATEQWGRDVVAHGSMLVVSALTILEAEYHPTTPFAALDEPVAADG